MALSATTAIAENWETSPSSRRVLVGLLGRGIQLSRTPAMHEAEGRAQGLAYVYTLLDTETMGETAPPLGDLITFAGHFGFTGFNVTFPYKQEIIPFLDELSEAAEILGSVNTVVFRRGRRIGHNTDMWGFKESFRHGLAGEKCREVLLLGAGGAGAAVAHALLESGVETLLVTDLQADRAEALALRLRSAGGTPKVEVVSDLAAASPSRRRHRQRDAGRDGKAARHADRRRSAAAGVLGRRHRLPAARNGAAQGGTATGLPHAQRRGHGGVPGCAGI